jgi:VWFA-related protein
MRTLAGAILCIAFAAAQSTIPRRPQPASKKDNPTPGANIRVDTTLILVPVTVNDPINRPVSGLEKENFRVFEDSVEQEITQFAMDDEPVAVGLVFDTSGSMGAKLVTSRLAAAQFFRISNPEDEFFLVEFDDSPHLRTSLTHDTGLIENQLTFSRSHGSTALLDAIYLALHEMKNSKKNKKALLLITDGGDNHSRYSMREVTNLVRESDVLIYSIGVFGGGSTPEEAGGPGLLRHISEQTGGRLFEAIPAELPDVAKKIGIELRNRYILAYSPKNQQRDGKYHKIIVKVVPPRGLPKLTAHWRLGYNAPVE